MGDNFDNNKDNMGITLTDNDNFTMEVPRMNSRRSSISKLSSVAGELIPDWAFDFDSEEEDLVQEMDVLFLELPRMNSFGSQSSVSSRARASQCEESVHLLEKLSIAWSGILMHVTGSHFNMLVQDIKQRTEPSLTPEAYWRFWDLEKAERRLL